MNYQLTIFDAPIFYMQGISDMLVKNNVFASVSVFQVRREFLDSYEKNPTEFVMYGSSLISMYDVFDLVESVRERNPRVKNIVVGNYYDISDIRKLYERGVQCYLDRDTEIAEFLDAIKILKHDNIYVCNSAKERMINYISHQHPATTAGLEPLTKREIEVMKLICDGFSSKMISEKLFISVNTVETHRKKILMKLNVKNSIGIVKYAVENNMLE
ncbi:response regulator transcription factor [Weeksellaceae bacterium A-14]|uniref:response regulator transcription factor n=1 Tax=Daejeonia sp. YH14 TaxID=3439042 RepID=UPI0031E49A0A